MCYIYRTNTNLKNFINTPLPQENYHWSDDKCRVSCK